MEQREEGKKQDAKGIRLFAIRSMLYALSCLLVFAGGCATNTSTQYVRQNFDYKSNIKKMAVLPFESLTNDEYAGEKIRKTVITELLSRGVDVIEPGEVTRVLIDQKIRYLSSVRTMDLQNMAKVLGVETLMMGSVEAYDISRGISVTYPEVTINIRLVEASSGNIIWSVHRQRLAQASPVLARKVRDVAQHLD